MQEATLPSPDTGASGYHLRRVAVRTISQLEIVASSYPNGVHPGAAKLAAFFQACADHSANIGKIAPAITVTPVTSSGAVNSTQQLTVNKGASTGAVTYQSQDPAIASVDANGLVTRKRAGQTTILVRVAADATYRGGSRSVSVTVTA